MVLGEREGRDPKILTLRAIQQKFPNDWVVIDAFPADSSEAGSGIVLFHHPDKNTFQRTVEHLPGYGDTESEITYVMLAPVSSQV